MDKAGHLFLTVTITVVEMEENIDIAKIALKTLN